MKIGDTVPEPGTTFDWDLDELVTRTSYDCDRYEETTKRCTKCGELWCYGYEYGFASNADRCDRARSCDPADLRPATPAEAWAAMMVDKRNDDQYQDVVESIREHGFLAPLTATVRDGVLRLVDGNHRVAAALELGLETVPVEVFEHVAVRMDSGEWALGDEITTETEPIWAFA